MTKTKWYQKPIYLLFALALVLSFSLVTAVPAWADATPHHYVDPAGSNTHPYDTWAKAAHKIQDAIDAAGAGDTIIVAAGLYPEAITIGKANLTLESASKWGAIIRPTSTPVGWPEAVVYITADGVTVDGFEIDGTTVCDNGILGWETSGLTIKNNKIHGAVREWDGCGILLFSWGNSGTVYNNRIEGNEVYDTGRMGIMVMDYGGAQNTYTVTSGNIITGNTVYDVWKVTWDDHGGGIQINVAKDCSIINNLVYDVRNGQRGIYMFGSATGNTITGNTIRDNPIGIQLWISGDGGTTIDWGGETPTSPQVHYNNIYGNSISENVDWDPWLPYPFDLTPHVPVPPGQP
jgi:parallel beta-helix repeat protein